MRDTTDRQCDAVRKLKKVGFVRLGCRCITGARMYHLSRLLTFWVVFALLGLWSTDVLASFPATVNITGYRIGQDGPGNYASADAACTAEATSQNATGSLTTTFPVPNSTQAFANCLLIKEGQPYRNTGIYYNAPPPSCPTYPVAAVLSGATCTCKPEHRQNARDDGCYQSETVDKPRAVKKEPPKVCSRFGNPIYPLTGSKKDVVETGLSVGGQALRLTYDSARHTAATAAAVAAKDYGDPPSFGALWLSSLHRKLVFSPAGFGAQLFRGDGAAASFRYQGNVYVPDADSSDQLVRINDSYRYTDASSKSIETYTSTGQLTSLADAAGNTLSFTYSAGVTATSPAAGYLMQVTDQTGRSLRFEYALPSGGAAATDGRVSRILNTASQAIVPTYDTHGNLASLTWEDSKTRQFLYENASFPWALTGVIDENNSRLSTFGYDSAGRAISTERAGGVNRFSVSYGTPPAMAISQVYDPATLITDRYHDWQAPAGVTLATPNGQTADLGATLVLGAPVMTSISQPAGSGCAAATSASTYDVSGNVISKDDFSGQRTCYAYDTKNRETVRVEGLSSTANCATVLPANASLPLDSRKTETNWHPDWHLPVKVSQPLSITSLIYHGQPDPTNSGMVANCSTAIALPNGKPLPLVCKQVVQATTDADGHFGLTATLDTGVAQRVSRFTYDVAGRMLTKTDSLNRTTTYTYYSATSFTGLAPNEIGHTAGDLQSITNAAGHVTTFNEYDLAGRVKKMTDPKGVVTDTVYTPRGWIASTTVTPPGGLARTTTYTYDNAGQLTGVVMPDATTLSYSYDAAHRLTGVTDTKGNTVTYTLNNMGNKVGEQVKDPQGNLQRNITRVYDALNRVQQTTGASN